MKTIAVIGQKGGTGKTTITQGLAVAASLAGLNVAILDLDPQTNSASWQRRRAKTDLAAVAARSCQAGELPHVLEALEKAGADMVLIDTAGKLSLESISAARVADLVLIPARRQIFDVETLEAVRDTLHQAKNPPAYLVPYGHHPSVKDPIAPMLATGEHFGIAVAPVGIAHRSIYADAPALGKAPQEMEPDGKAAAELQALYEFVSSLTRSQSQPVKRKAAK